MKSIVKGREIKAVDTVKAETKVVEVLAQGAKNAVDVVKEIVKTEEKSTESITQKMAKVAKAVETPVQKVKTAEILSEKVTEVSANEDAKEPTFVVEERQPVKSRKTRKKVEAPVDRVYVEFFGAQINIHDVVESAKEHYKALYEKDNGPISTISVYVKPEEGVAYYVVNGIGGDDYKVGI